MSQWRRSEYGWEKFLPTTATGTSDSTSDKYMGITGKQQVKTQSHSKIQLTAPCLPVSFQSLLPTNKKLSYFDSSFMDLLSRSNISSCSFLPLHVGKLLFTDGSIVPHVRGVHFWRAYFCLPPPPPPPLKLHETDAIQKHWNRATIYA